MKRMKNIALFAIVFAVLFSFASSVKALEVKSENNLVEEGTGHTFLYYPEDSQTKVSLAFAWAALNADGTVVYCAKVTSLWPGGGGIGYDDPTDPMAPGLIYLLQKSKELEQNGQLNNENRFIIQGAIWLYLANSGHFENEDSLIDEHGVLPRMRELVAQAKAATYSSVNQGTVGDVSTYNGGVMSLNDSKDYYVSSLIPSVVTGVDTYSVSVSGVNGAVIVPQSGSDASAIPANQGFYVKVPYANGQNLNKQVTVSVTVQTNAWYVSPVATYDAYQDIIGLFDTKKPVTKTFTLRTAETVCVDYVIVGNTIPDPALTDPTPEKKCYEKGINYNQENKLTTRTKCVFKGWNTSSDLTGEWIDGTALNNDMTLYGAWDCPSVVVPPTAAQAPFIVAGLGLIGAAGVLGYRVYNKKK